MSLLTEAEMPTALVVDGEKYEIYSDFRTWIKLTLDFFLKEITPLSISKALCSVYKQIPPNPEKAIYAMFEFYTTSNRKTREKGGQDSPPKLIFDFEADASLIYSSFFEQYHINLINEDLHWWVFRSLFDNLSADTAFGKALHFRSVDTGQIKDKEQRKYYLRMKKLYELPDNRSEDEKEKDFAENLSNIL